MENLVEMNKKKNFYSGWHLVGSTSEVLGEGSYINFEIGDEPIVVVRGKNDELKALSRVCRHRGFDMLEGELTPDGNLIGRTGKVKRLRCPYHAWTYDLDGKLIAAPLSDQICDFKKSDISLPDFAVCIIDENIFVNLDKSADHPAL